MFPHSSRTRRIGVAGGALAVAMTFGLAGCANVITGHGSELAVSVSSSSAPSGSSTAPPSASQQSDDVIEPSGSSALDAKLLTTSDLPTGWSDDSSNDDNGDDDGEPACLKEAEQADNGASDQAEADFVEGSDLPTFDENLYQYSSPSAAAQVFAETTNALANCSSFTLNLDGQTVRAKLKPFSYNGIGDQSKGYAMTFTLLGSPFVALFGSVQKGSVFAEFTYTDTAYTSTAAVPFRSLSMLGSAKL